MSERWMRSVSPAWHGRSERCCRWLGGAAGRWWAVRRQRLARLRSDQAGSISIASVFALLLLVMLLGMVMNSSRHVDRKVRLQNAADAVAWSGAQVMARGMNGLAFTNHLLSDVFALTAFFREARDRDAQRYTTEILDNWERIGPFMATSEFPPFAGLGEAINEKVPIEREMVTTYSDWASAASEMILPVLEEILATEAIPEYQRALAAATPMMAQQAAAEMSRRHGQAWPRGGPLYGGLWRTIVDPVGGMEESTRRSLPVIDPSPAATDMGGSPALRQDYFTAAVEQREDLAHRYLREWNSESLTVFDQHAPMSQFANLWRGFSCGHLKHLLEVEYPNRNLPFQIRDRAEGPGSQNDYLEQDFMFVGVVYQPRSSDWMPGVFHNPAGFDRQAFAQVSLFVPRRRLVRVIPGQNVPSPSSMGGVPGGVIITPPAPLPQPPPPGMPAWVVVRQSGDWHPDGWNLVTQNWNAQLVPATAGAIGQILSSVPYASNMPIASPANWLSLSSDDLGNLTHH
ncbi:MAG: hypothetical protein RLY70_113 [Planctomycetota bacterium]